MTISALTDNHPGSHTPAEHGLSYLIEYDGKRLLFDTGQSDMFLKNAEAMKISMTNIDAVILSHGHFDHGNGLGYLSGISTLYGIMGGFHLKEINHQTKETIRYIKKNKLKHVLPSHCTDLPALSAFYRNFGMELVKTGNIYKF